MPFHVCAVFDWKTWKPAILWKMTEGVSRFGEMKRFIPQISEKMLTQHLRELEEDGLIIRTIHSEKPPMVVVYKLTSFGVSVQPVLEQLNQWGESAKLIKKQNPTRKAGF